MLANGIPKLHFSREEAEAHWGYLACLENGGTNPGLPHQVDGPEASERQAQQELSWALSSISGTWDVFSIGICRLVARGG